MKIIFPLLLVSVLLTACFGPQNNDHKNHIYANDFEPIKKSQNKYSWAFDMPLDGQCLVFTRRFRICR